MRNLSWIWVCLLVLIGGPLDASKFKVYRPRIITTTTSTATITSDTSPQVSPTTSPRTISDLFSSFQCQDKTNSNSNSNINGNSYSGRKRKYDSFAEIPTESPSFDTLFREYAAKPANTACAQPPIIPEDRRPDQTRLRIASFNAEWLFLFGGSGSVRCPGPQCAWSNVNEAKNHLFRVVNLITKLDADLVHLNEVEDCRVLDLLLELLPHGHGYAAYMIPGTDTMTGQNVALLTRIDPDGPLKRSDNRVPYPIATSKCQKRVSYSRGQRRSGTVGLSKHYLSQFTVNLAGDSFTLVMAGAHFIAQPGNADRCLRREAQATVLTRLLQSTIDRLRSYEHPRPVQVIITGDLNDHDADAPGANGELPRSATLQVLKNLAGMKLFSAAQWISNPQDRYSSWHDRNGNCRDDGPAEHSLIDHVLVSEGLKRRIRTVWMDHNETVSCSQRTSDHFPIIFEIK